MERFFSAPPALLYPAGLPTWLDRLLGAAHSELAAIPARFLVPVAEWLLEQEVGAARGRWAGRR